MRLPGSPAPYDDVRSRRRRLTLAEALACATRRLRLAGTGGRSEARRLLEFVTGHDAATLLAGRDKALTAAAATAFERAVVRRERGEPIAYIVGDAGFFGRTFTVTPAVLVPRPESEHLIEAAIADLRARPLERRRLADIGTGSGVLALTLVAEVAGARALAIDVSEAALAIARTNAGALGLAGRIEFICGELAEPLRGRAPIDVLVANLPYVASADVPRPPDPVSFEPRIALDGGSDGLALYRRLLADLAACLANDASLYLEAASPAIEELARLAQREFPTAHIEIGEDYAQLERYVGVQLRAVASRP